MKIIFNGYLRVDYWLCSSCNAKMKRGDLMYIIIEGTGRELKAVCRGCVRETDALSQRLWYC